jgi:large subunit ribosomal protein L25
VASTSEALHARKREASGTKACRLLRQSGEVPAVLYGHKEETVPIQVSLEELETALRHHTRILELRLGKKTENVLVREVQYDALGNEIVHADFLRVAMDEVVELRVAVVLKGAPKIEHTVLQQTLDAVEIECLPANIPDAIVLNVADLKEGESKEVRDLVVPPGVKILTDPDIIVATLTKAAEEEVVAAAPAEVGAAEPELIGRKPEEVEEGEEAPEKEKKEKKEEPKGE